MGHQRLLASRCRVVYAHENDRHYQWAATMLESVSPRIKQQLCHWADLASDNRHTPVVLFPATICAFSAAAFTYEPQCHLIGELSFWHAAAGSWEAFIENFPSHSTPHALIDIETPYAVPKSNNECDAAAAAGVASAYHGARRRCLRLSRGQGLAYFSRWQCRWRNLLMMMSFSGHW